MEDTEKFVQAVSNGNNVDANKILEQIIVNKCMEKIRNTLKND